MLLVPPLAGILGLALGGLSIAFHVPIVYGYIAGLFLCCIPIIKRYEQHHSKEQYDDKLSVERMEQAREELIRLWGGENEK
jgi:hypothetical protein